MRYLHSCSCLKHHRRHPGGMQASGGSQNQLRPVGCWDTLSPLWQSHDHAHRRHPRLEPHGNWEVGIARIYGIYLAADLFIQHGRLGAHVRSTFVLEHLSRTPTTDPKSHPFHIFSKLRSIRLPQWHPLLNLRTTPPSLLPTTSPSQFSTQNTSDYPSGRPFQTPQPKSFPELPDGVPLKFYDQPSIWIYHLVSIMKFPTITPSISPS